MIRSPESPVMSVIAWFRWTFIWSIAFCMCSVAFAAALTKVSRCRSRVRTRQISSAGRNEPRNKPTECRYRSHSQSATSDLRPGTTLT